MDSLHTPDVSPDIWCDQLPYAVQKGGSLGLCYDKMFRMRVPQIQIWKDKTILGDLDKLCREWAVPYHGDESLDILGLPVTAKYGCMRS